MAPARLRTEKLSSRLRIATARLLLLCLHAIILGVVMAYALGWLALAQSLMDHLVSEFRATGVSADVFDQVRRMVRLSVPGALVVVSAMAPLVGAVLVVRTGGSTRPPGSVRLEPTDAPELWAMVAELDSSLGTRMNHTSIWLTPHANAAVAVSPPRGRPIRKTLYLGVPLLAGVDREELRAILCHELAHCAGRHHDFGVLALRGLRKLHVLEEELSGARTVETDMTTVNWLLRVNARVLSLLFRGYRVPYERITRSARHRQELEADQVAARHVGVGVMRRALVRADMAAAAAAARPGRGARRHKAEETSSHPALRQRLAALGTGQGEDPASTGAGSLRLLSSTAEGTGARWPKLPHPTVRGRRSADSDRRSRKAGYPAPSMSLSEPTTMVVLGLAALSLVLRIVENWPW